MIAPLPGLRAGALFLLCLSPSFAAPPQTDLDTLMAEALERRQVNWAQHNNYFYREREVLSIEGSFDGAPLHGSEREFLWYVRDGHMVRSPIVVDGVRVPEDERDQAELRFIERLRARQKRESERGVNRQSFFGFHFEPGNYFFAGRRMHEGRELLVVEHYPLDAFGDDDEEPSRKVALTGSGEVDVEEVPAERRSDDGDSESKRQADRTQEGDREGEDDAVERQMNKVMYATMLVDPEEKQIVRMTIDNLGFDFLPVRWLFQIGAVEATMTMHEPFEDIWLARDIEAFASVSTAAGDVRVRYRTVFSDYVEVRVRYRLPGGGG